jgi:hypothetical protein
MSRHRFGHKIRRHCRHAAHAAVGSRRTHKRIRVYVLFCVQNYAPRNYSPENPSSKRQKVRPSGTPFVRPEKFFKRPQSLPRRPLKIGKKNCFDASNQHKVGLR